MAGNGRAMLHGIVISAIRSHQRLAHHTCCQARRAPDLCRQLRRHAECRAGRRETLDECENRGALVGGCCEMQGVAGTKTSHVQINKLRLHSETTIGHWQRCEVLCNQLVEYRERVCALLQGSPSGS